MKKKLEKKVVEMVKFENDTNYYRGIAEKSGIDRFAENLLHGKFARSGFFKSVPLKAKTVDAAVKEVVKHQKKHWRKGIYDNLFTKVIKGDLDTTVIFEIQETREKLGCAFDRIPSGKSEFQVFRIRSFNEEEKIVEEEQAKIARERAERRVREAEEFDPTLICEKYEIEISSTVPDLEDDFQDDCKMLNSLEEAKKFIKAKFLEWKMELTLRGCHGRIEMKSADEFEAIDLESMVTLGSFVYSLSSSAFYKDQEIDRN